LKLCNLCGKAGHNPYRCWSYSTMTKLIFRASDLDLCIDCLRPWKPWRSFSYCSYCTGNSARVFFPQENPQEKLNKFQTEIQEGKDIIENQKRQIEELNSKILSLEDKEDNYLIRECHAELKEGKAITENQKMKIKELNSKITSLEDKLESSITTINELNWKLQSTVKEKEQELQKVNKLDSLCKEKEMELRNLQEQISQKDIELEQHRGTNAQPYQTVPVAAQRPSQTSNHLDHINETNGIKANISYQTWQTSVFWRC